MYQTRKLRSGFTFIEVVIAMLVMGILAAAAVPRYIGAMARYRVDAAARRIVADLSYVRGRAMMKGPIAEEWVGFYPATEEYEMNNTADINHPTNEYWVKLAKSAYPVDLVSANFVDTEGFYVNDTTIRFDMHGFPRVGSPSSEPLASGEIVVASGSEQRTIVIDPVTGKASIQ